MIRLHRLIMKVKRIDRELGDRLKVAVEEGNVALAEMIAEKLAKELLAEDGEVEVDRGWRLRYRLEPVELSLEQGGAEVARLGECDRMEDVARFIQALLAVADRKSS